MRVVSIACLLLVMISCCLAEESSKFTTPLYHLGYADGVNGAKDANMFGWFIAGLTTSLPGTLVSYIAIVEPPEDMAYNMNDKSYSFVMGYMDGYTKEIRTRRAKHALLGVVVQLAIILLITQTDINW